MSDTLTFARLDFEAGGFSYRGYSLAQAQDAQVSDTVVLPALKAWLAREVDRSAELLREAAATPGAGQAMEYQEAQAQAFAALLATGPVQASGYPMLAASIGVDIDPQTGAPATDVLGVARCVQAAYAAWLKTTSAIRKARLAGKAAIDAATSIDAAAAAFDAIVWPKAA